MVVKENIWEGLARNAVLVFTRNRKKTTAAHFYFYESPMAQGFEQGFTLKLLEGEIFDGRRS